MFDKQHEYFTGKVSNTWMRATFLALCFTLVYYRDKGAESKEGIASLLATQNRH